MGLKRLKQPKIFSSVVKNAKGDATEITLTPNEQYHANHMQRVVNERFGNSLGYEVSITTLKE